MTLIKFQKPQTALNNVNNKFTTVSPLFDTLIEDFFGGMRPEMNSLVPAVNILETNEMYKIELAAPGLTKSDFKINLDGKNLIIAAEKNQENKTENSNYALREFSYSNFKRSFNLPDLVNFDEITAEYRDGILHLTIPKREEAKLKTREIKIS